MGRAIAWALVAFIACTGLGLPVLYGLLVTLAATIFSTIGTGKGST